MGCQLRYEARLHRTTALITPNEAGAAGPGRTVSTSRIDGIVHGNNCFTINSCPYSATYTVLEI